MPYILPFAAVPELDEVARAAGERRIFAEKSQFSMLVPEVRSMLESGGIRSVILTGIEVRRGRSTS